MRAAVYTRISRDDLGDAAGVDRQLDDCKQLIASNGWVFAGEYRENDVSASKGKPRPVYDQIIQDAIEKRIDVVLVQEVDRLYREPRELEDLIDVVVAHKLLIVHYKGLLDLTNPNGQMIARIFAATGKNEADRIGVRVKRQKQQRAEQGIPQGGKYRIMGYTRDWKLIPDEVEIVKEIFKRRAAGESAHAVAKSFNKRGVPTVSGSTWHGTSLNRLVENPIFMGKRRYNGKIIGDIHPDIEHFISPSVWEKANSDVAKRKGGFNTRRYVLTGILRCSHCNRNLSGKPGLYRCDAPSGGCGKTSIKQQYAEAALLNEIYNAGEVNEAEDNTDEVDAKIAIIDDSIKKTRALHLAGDLDLEDMTALLKGYREQIKALRKSVVVSQTAKNAVYSMVEFEALELAQKKIHIARHWDFVKVLPVTKRGRIFEPQRLEIHWHDGRVTTPTMDLPDLKTFIDAMNDVYGPADKKV